MHFTALSGEACPEVTNMAAFYLTFRDFNLACRPRYLGLKTAERKTCHFVGRRIE
jgi:hypothetical protein